MKALIIETIKYSVLIGAVILATMFLTRQIETAAQDIKEKQNEIHTDAQRRIEEVHKETVRNGSGISQINFLLEGAFIKVK